MLIVFKFLHPAKTGLTVPSQFTALKLTVLNDSQFLNASNLIRVIPSGIVTLLTPEFANASLSISFTDVGNTMFSAGTLANIYEPIKVTFEPMLIVFKLLHPTKTGSTVPLQFTALKLTVLNDSQFLNASKLICVIPSGIVTLLIFEFKKASLSIPFTS